MDPKEAWQFFLDIKPHWLTAATAIASAGFLLNLFFNIFNYWRAGNTRYRDFAQSEFSSLVAQPLADAISEFEKIKKSFRVLKHQDAFYDDFGARGDRLKSLQIDEIDPAIQNLQLIFERADQNFPLHSRKWSDYIDLTDALLEAVNPLSVENMTREEAAIAFNSAHAAIDTFCTGVRKAVMQEKAEKMGVRSPHYRSLAAKSYSLFRGGMFQIVSSSRPIFSSLSC